MLSLHKKAQNGGLTAQEVFWLENQQNDHPYFGMVYMILARHHYRNQSTIRNRALLKGATFANNRALLRNYLEDTLVPPKYKPVPVREMKPILDKKELEAAQSEADSKTSNDSSEVSKKESTSNETVESSTDEASASTEIVEVAANTIVATEQVNEAGDDKVQLEKTSEAPAAEVVEKEDAPAATVEDAEKAAPETEDKKEVSPAVAQSDSIEKEDTPAEETTAISEEAPVQLGSTKSEINWFLNMRVKLRADKFKNTEKRIRAGLESFEKPAPTQVASAITETPEAKVVAPAKEKEATTTVASTPKPAAKAKPKRKPRPKSDNKAASKVATPADKNYEIGEYSSFSFMSGDATEVVENEIDKGFSNRESIEFQSNKESSEIIVEEDGRIVEVSVSPEALSKYFKGKLPIEEQSFSIGEFHIELDEEEYRALEDKKEEIPVSPIALEEVKPKTDDLIEKFIENEPGITRGGADYSKLGDLSKDSNRDDGEWVTETLAKIYELQGNNSKALKIYQKLRLRFPEKNDYFAGLIDNLKR